ncbi:MAG: carbon-nitrogen hydrolase family protein [Anaerolineaceae bacterium]
MKVGLIAEQFINGDVEFNLHQIEKWLNASSHQGFDLLCFGEAFLQGFDGLTWEYMADLQIALEQTDPRILSLSKLAKVHQTGLGFGYIEKEGQTLYSSYLVVSAQGEKVTNFRRISPGWKESITDERYYREGHDFKTFELCNKKIAIAICGDLWHDDLLANLKKQQAELVLWPLYLDYTTEQWVSGEREAYARRAGELNVPVLMINSYVDALNLAKGGACVFSNGMVAQELPMEETGLLEVVL